MSENDTELSEYTVTLNGIEHTMLLDKEGAKAYGDAAKKGGSAPATKKAAAPANKSSE